MNTAARYAKAITALVLAVGPTLYTALGDGVVTPQEWVKLSMAAAVAVGVAVVPNAKAKAEAEGQ